MKHFIYLAFILLVISCTEKEIKTNENPYTVDGKSKEFVMYEMSEMAAHMELMFTENERLKEKILNGEELGTMPAYFEGILTKQLTDPSEFDSFYKEHAKLFLEQQQSIYNNPTQAKSSFNASIDACIKCHEVKCGGPIARIKKLYIK